MLKKCTVRDSVFFCFANVWDKHSQVKALAAGFLRLQSSATVLFFRYGGIYGRWGNQFAKFFGVKFTQ